MPGTYCNASSDYVEQEYTYEVKLKYSMKGYTVENKSVS